jgi:YesN/AraC family two-component response regulator
MDEKIMPKAWGSLMNSSNFIPVVVRSVERFYDTSWTMEPNRHELFEMVYIKRGNAVFEIAEKAADIGPNNIIIIKPRQPHKFIVKSEEGCEFIVFNFKFENRMNNEVSEISLEDFINFVENRETGAFIKLKVNAKNDIITLLNRILKEKENNDIGSEFLNYLLMLELFVLISRALKMEWENSIKGKSSKLNEVIQASVNFINNNYERDISLKDISKYVFLSQSYFAKAFKEITGVSPINYLIKARVERDKELLAGTNEKAGDIAISVGFSNQQRFNEIFKKYTGMTPLQYRKSLQSKRTNFSKK